MYHRINRPGRVRWGAFFAAVCILAVFLAACDNPVNGGQPVYGISISVTEIHTFDEVTAGYMAVTPLTVTNTGNQAIGGLTAALSGNNAAGFTLTGGSIASIAVGETTTFTVGPNTGFGEGTYTATVTVTGDNGIIPQSFTVSFRVINAFTTIEAISAYLAEAQGGTLADDPVPLPAKLSAADWAALLDAISTAEKYVALDLSTSAVAGTDTEFDPGAANTGEKYVVRLVLPEAAERMKVGS